MSDSISTTAAPYVAGIDSYIGRVVTGAVIGGTASVIGGGKFANGALTTAFGYLFNQAASGNTQQSTEFGPDRCVGCQNVYGNPADFLEIGGIRNQHLAGQNHPRTGIPFDADGYPDFSKVAKTSLEVDQSGNRYSDEKAANQKAGYKETPREYTWHHHQNGRTMVLVPTDVHLRTGHTGGVANRVLQQSGMRGRPE